MKVVGREEMRRLDREAVEKYKIPVAKLMEAAGAKVAEEAGRLIKPLRGKKIIVVCGKGNNGGDGLVAARRLKGAGARVMVLLIGAAGDLSSQTAEQWKRAKRARVSLFEIGDEKKLKDFEQERAQAHLLVDALFGTGLSRPIQGSALEAVRWMNASGKPVLAVDLPSGMDADSGAPLPEAVRAQHTVTFGLPKLGLLTPLGASISPTWSVASIGFPKDLLEASWIETELFGVEEIRRWLPRKDENVHKGSRGKVLVVGGSPGLSGAPSLCAEAVLRAGAGLCFAAIPQKVLPSAALPREVVTVPLSGGEILVQDDVERLMETARTCRAAVVGPGLGRKEESAKALEVFLRETEIPAVVDADALFFPEVLEKVAEKRKAPWILTPHSGEAARLWGGKTAQDVEQSRPFVARQLARRYNGVVVLKGRYSMIAHPEGKLYINKTGSRALATAGSGDVLAGILGSFLAQGCETFSAAAAAVGVHGLLGEKAAEEIGPDGALAGDFLKMLPWVLRKLREA